MLWSCALTGRASERPLDPPSDAGAPVSAIPAGGTPVLADPALPSFTFQRPSAAGAEAKTVAVTGQPFTQALQVTTRVKPASDYNIQLRAPTAAAVSRGDVLLGIFYARALATSSETGEARVGFVFERAGDPYTKSASFPVRFASRDWQRFTIPFTAAESYAAGGAQCNLKVGYDPQTVELGGISVLNYKTSLSLESLPGVKLSYGGMEPNAEWRAAARARIESIRKGDLTVRVTGSLGQPLRNASVSVVMKRHAFGFGSAVVASRIMDATSADNARYREWIEKLFNRVVIENELKWPGWENMSQRQRTLDGLAWLRQRGIAVRGHCLVWPSWSRMPSNVEQLKGDPAALRARVTDHITDEVGTLAGQIVDWDVINEPYSNHDLMDILGQ